MPQFSFAGNFTAQGGKFTRIVYEDKVSTVSGTGTVFLDYSTEILRSFNVTLGLSDALGKESYSLIGNAVNSSEKKFTQIAFLKDIFFDIQLAGQSFPLERLMANQEKDNKTSVQVSLLGTLENPNISVSFFKDKTFFIFHHRKYYKFYTGYFQCNIISKGVKLWQEQVYHQHAFIR